MHNIDRTLKNISLTITYSGTYSIQIHLTEKEAIELVNEVNSNGLNKFKRFQKEADLIGKENNQQ